MQTIDKLLNIKYPIIQGGMANISTGEFAAKVSNAGALGVIGAGGMDTEELVKNIKRCKQLTDRPFGVNIMLMNPHADDMAQAVVQEGVKILTTGAGIPAKYMPGWKESGIFVMPVVSSVALAKKMEKLGADAVIAEGCESGGHVGEMTTMTLVPQVCDAVDIPVIAAGGIGDARGLAAAFILGAVGVQMGTAFLASKECPIHEAYKQAVIKAKDNDTTVTGRISGTPVRIIKNSMSREYIKKEKEGLSKEELERYTLGSLRRAVFEGDTKTGSLMAGQVAGQISEIKSIEDILTDIQKGFEDVMGRIYDMHNEWR
ncbi:MAG: nitronate monooxygenase [Lachnospiraceae bacterium]|nr:nitronate monooxygenase [Lachnospiraceae bacterium]